MLKRWGRNVWRYAEPWLAQLVWLDPSVAAAHWRREPAPPLRWPVRRPGSFEPVLVPREGPNVA